MAVNFAKLPEPLRKPISNRVGSRKSETTMRYTPKNLDEVRTCLSGCPAEMEVEVERGIPVTAKTVAELRALSVWPRGDWVLDVRIDPYEASRLGFFHTSIFSNWIADGTKEMSGC
jgi:hypothetical protein